MVQVPVYIWAPEEEGQFQPGRCSRWWLRNSLEALEQDLKALGSRIVYRSAPESRIALLQLIQETGAKVRTGLIVAAACRAKYPDTAASQIHWQGLCNRRVPWLYRNIRMFQIVGFQHPAARRPIRPILTHMQSL